MYYDFLILKIGPHGFKMKIELCNFSVKWGRVVGYSKLGKKKSPSFEGLNLKVIGLPI